MKSTEEHAAWPVPVAPDEFPLPLAEAAQPLSFAAASDAAATASGDCLRPFVNERCNSRVGSSLPKGTWKLRWQAEINPALHPSFVMCSGHRILVQGTSLWQLFDGQGGSIAFDRLGRGDMLIDDEHALFYFPKPDASLAARRLSDGSPAWTIKPAYGDEFVRAFAARRGERFVVLSIEQWLQPPSQYVSDLCVIEVHDLTGIEAGRPGALRLDTQVAMSEIRSPHLLAALHHDYLVLAATDRLYLMGLDLHVIGDLKESFRPVAMSLDEMMRVYLLVQARDRRELWLVTERGELGLRFVLPPPFGEALNPPILGHDHTIYLINENRLLVLSRTGEVIREHLTADLINGAVITPDDDLLLSAGAGLFTFDASGKERVLFVTESDRFTTAPVLTDRGEIILASAQRLYCLVAEAEILQPERALLLLP